MAHREEHKDTPISETAGWLWVIVALMTITYLFIR
jgi:hypothetical protein